MLFNSIQYAIFLPIVFLLYWFVFKQLKRQNLFLLVASYVFYGWWDWRFLILIIFTSFCSYYSGIFIEKSEGNRKKQQWISAVNIIVNLAILCVFKYFNFFSENLYWLVKNIIGYELDWVTLDILLPVGISFYTFQALSYSIDIYQRKIPATRDIVAFFAFISFFPALVAGPIERATNLLPQMLRPRKFEYADAVDGCRQMLWGFFKKIVIADNCSLCVNHIFDHYTDLPGSTLLIGGFWFVIQVYCDFSGYSDIAIGTGRLFGIQLMRNFNNPLFSRNIAEFWRRWRISLTTWFRDYIYFPLGGSRCGNGKTIRNTMIIFLVSGFWHGANWTYIIWGFLHGLLFIPLLLRKTNKKYRDTVAEGNLFPSLKEFYLMAVNITLIALTFIIFRAANIEQAYYYLKGVFSMSLFSAPTNWFYSGIYIIPFTIIFILVEWFQRERRHGLDLAFISNAWVRYVIYSMVWWSILIFVNEPPAEFIYFKF